MTEAMKHVGSPAQRGNAPTHSSSPHDAAQTKVGSSGWKAFERELDHFLTLRGVTGPELAAQLGAQVTADTVRQWRREKGPQRPAFNQLVAIARVLGMNDNPERNPVGDPTFLPRKMGILEDVGDDAFIAKARAIAKQSARLSSLAARVEVIRAGGLGALVEAVVQSGEWAIAVWPAMEGFSTTSGKRTLEYSLRMADRIDIRSTREASADTTLIWREFEDALDLAGAHKTGPTPPRWGGPEASSWAIRHIGRTHQSVVEFPHPHLQAVSVGSLSLHSWASDIAAHLARLLGYGLDSTRDLAYLVYGHRSITDAGEEREHFQESLLLSPRPKRVWSHWAWGSDAPRLITGSSGSLVHHIYLREDENALLRERDRVLAGYRARQIEVDVGHPDLILQQLKVRKKDVDRAAKHNENCLVIDMVEVPQGVPEDERRREKLKATFAVAAKALEAWVERGLIERDALETIWRGKADPHRDTLVRYLRETKPRMWG